MSEHRVVNNELSGHVEGPAVQAGSVGDVRVSSTVNNTIKEVRSLKAMATAYRTLASLAALCAIAAASHGATPLGGLAHAGDALALPVGWTAPTASWITERAELVGGAAQILLLVGLLALPRPRHIGWDLGQTMEWRGPSTVVLSFVLLVQCGYAWQALLTVGLPAAGGAWVLSRAKYRYGRSDHVTVAVGSIFLAVIFAPLLVLAWLFGRDAGSVQYAPADS